MNLRYFQIFVDGSFEALDDKTVGGKICLTQGGKIALFIYQKPDRKLTFHILSLIILTNLKSWCLLLRVLTIIITSNMGKNIGFV